MSRKWLTMLNMVVHWRLKHDIFNDYPLAPEKIHVTQDMLSPFQQQHFPTNKGTEKLVPHLGRLEKYVVHYRNLKLYLQLGFQVTKIHRVIRFRQGAWLKSFMELNIEQRREAAHNGDKARVGRYQCNSFSYIHLHLLIRCRSMSM